MSKIVAVKPHNVSLGVLDKDVQLHEDLQSVTFLDHNGTAHTVLAKVDGPFESPEAIVQAFEDGTLHTFKSHQEAADHYALYEGNEPFVERLRELQPNQGQTQSNEGRGY